MIAYRRAYSIAITFLLSVLFSGCGPAPQHKPAMRVQTKLDDSGKVVVKKRVMLSPRAGISMAPPKPRRGPTPQSRNTLKRYIYNCDLQLNLPDRYAVRLPKADIQNLAIEMLEK